MTAPTATPLWEVEHSYYCADSNYYLAGNRHHEIIGQYDTWAEFMAEEGDSDKDYNLLFRWDWNIGDGYLSDEEYDLGDTAEGRRTFAARFDDNERAWTLYLRWMGQRKGLYRWSEVKVCKADEPAVREWLIERGEYLRSLWAPLLTDAAPEKPPAA